jgi:acetate kinase
MFILTVNVGSSNIRLSAFTKDLKELASSKFHDNEGAPEEVLKGFLKTHEFFDKAVIGHRIVHGGRRFIEPTIIDKGVKEEIQRLSILAPIHNKMALKWINACERVFGEDTIQIAVFDTAFFSKLPKVTATYALPKKLIDDHGIQRFGFHGIAHKAMCTRWQEFHQNEGGSSRVISLQLGSGCSIAAIKDGEPRDTSMGFTPLEGLVMSTRSGDIDPGLLVYLQRTSGYSIDSLEEILNKSSGLLGISGLSGDMRVLLGSRDTNARLAVDIFCYRTRKYIGAYLTVLEGADVLIFGGGIGENSPEIRERILENMGWCGVKVDPAKNSAGNGKETRISSSSSKIDVWIIPVDESKIIAKETMFKAEELREVA